MRDVICILLARIMKTSTSFFQCYHTLNEGEHVQKKLSFNILQFSERCYHQAKMGQSRTSVFLIKLMVRNVIFYYSVSSSLCLSSHLRLCRSNSATPSVPNGSVFMIQYSLCINESVRGNTVMDMDTDIIKKKTRGVFYTEIVRMIYAMNISA